MIKSWKKFFENKIRYLKGVDSSLPRYKLSKEDLDNFFQDISDDFSQLDISIEISAHIIDSFLVEMSYRDDRHYADEEIYRSLLQTLDKMVYEGYLQELDERLGDHNLMLSKDIQGNYGTIYKGSIYLIVSNLTLTHQAKLNENNIHTEGSAMLLEFGLKREMLDDIFQDISDDFPELMIYVSSDDLENLLVDLSIDHNLDDETSFKYSINNIQDKLIKNKYIDQIASRFEDLGFEFSQLGVLHNTRICFVLRHINKKQRLYPTTLNTLRDGNRKK